MKDPEFIALRNKFLFAILIAVVFMVPLLIFVYKSYSRSDILTKLNKDETFSILIVSNDCDMCNVSKNIMKVNNVNFVVLNSSTNKDYESIMKKLGIENKRDEFPIIVYVEEGTMKANLYNITEKGLVEEFILNHNLINSD